MSIHGIARRATVNGNATPTTAPIYVSSTDNRVRLVTAGSGSAEVILQEASGASMFETLVTTRVLTTADSGKTFFLALAGGFTVTLPVLTAGFNCRFIVSIAPTTAYIIIANAANLDKMAGSVFEQTGGVGDVETTATADQMNFVASTAIVGDQADVCSDGTSWFGRMFVSAAGAGTFTG